MSDRSPLPGVMEAEYARGRIALPHLAWRYRFRAAAAVAAFRRLAPQGSGSVKLLDLGAAEGLTLLEMRRLLGGNGVFDGLELSDSLLGQAPPLPGNARLVKGNVMQVPPELPAGSYDLVTVLAVLEHLPDPAACLREAFRMLRPGGVVVATCPNPIWDEIAGRLGMVADEHHEQHLDGKGLVGMLSGAGFAGAYYEPFMWAPVGFLPYLKIPVPIDRAAQVDEMVQKLPFTGFTFVNQLVAARKPD